MTWRDRAEDIPAVKSGSPRDGVVFEHLGLVRAIAARISRSLPMAVDANDLFQAGVVGLLDALEQYDASRNADFDVYAKGRIKAAILACLHQFDWTSPGPGKSQGRRISADVAMDPARDQADTGTGEQFSSRTNWDTGIRMRRGPLDAAAGFSYPHGGGHSTPDVAGVPECQPDRICERNELRKAMDRAIERLPARYQEVLILSYADEMPLDEIGGLFGVSSTRISQIRRKATERMWTELRSGGFVPGAPPVVARASLATAGGKL
jgi:RNA polymerase sigma factor for flagellar operon FliA